MNIDETSMISKILKEGKFKTNKILSLKQKISILSTFGDFNNNSLTLDDYNNILKNYSNPGFFLYSNRVQLVNLLFDEGKVMFIESNEKTNIHFCFYLSLLIKHDIDFFYFDYDVGFIKALHEKQKFEKYTLRKLILAKLIIELIDNQRSSLLYDRNNDELLDKIKKNNKDIIEENNKFELISSDKFANFNIDEIYAEIIIKIIENNYDSLKIEEYFKQMELQNIELTPRMIEIINTEIKNKNIEALGFDESKFYCLLKYVFKYSIDIYRFPILLKQRIIYIQDIKKKKNLFSDNIEVEKKK